MAKIVGGVSPPSASNRRKDHYFAGHRVCDEAFLMRQVLHRLDLLRRRQRLSRECDPGPQFDQRYGQLACVDLVM